MEFKTIIEAAVHICGVRHDLIMSTSRDQDIVRARQMAMWIGVRKLGLGTQVVGRKFLKDHSTVVHACKAIDQRIAAGGQTEEIIALIIQTAEIMNGGVKIEKIAKAAKAMPRELPRPIVRERPPRDPRNYEVGSRGWFNANQEQFVWGLRAIRRAAAREGTIS